MQDQILSPSDFVGLLNQTLEFSYPVVAIEGELSNFRVSKNRWVYFSLKDEESSVDFFGTVYMLPGPLRDGLMVRVSGSPRLHQRFGFTVNMTSIVPVGEGSLKKASDLLMTKLKAEGLFAEERKRLIPSMPHRVGLITATGSAAYTDFIKILNARWGGVEVSLLDVLVQGDQSPSQISSAIGHFNQLSEVFDVLVITRGGGSADDLSAFSDERVVRAVAASRIPTLVAVGHEKDISLAELAADRLASTPSNAAELLFPDRTHELTLLENSQTRLTQLVNLITASEFDNLKSYHELFKNWFKNFFLSESRHLESTKRLISIFNPETTLRRGYAIVSKAGKQLSKVGSLRKNDKVDVRLSDGTINTVVEKITLNGQA